MISNLKNDVIAKNEYIEILKREGYDNARVTSAATLTEWKSAIENQNTYYFVVAIQKNDEWIFTKYSFDEFMQFSNIPPFKVFFNIPDTTIKSLPANKKTNSVVLTKNRLNKMIDVFEYLRKNS